MAGALAVAVVISLGAASASAAATGYLFWTDPAAGSIGRVNVDGSDPHYAFITGLAAPEGIAVDDRHVYWTSPSDGCIGRAKIDGSGVEPHFISAGSSPFGLAVRGDQLYWTHNVPGGAISRANLDGSGERDLFVPRIGAATGIALDRRHIYWNEPAHAIGRANLDGSGVQESFLTLSNPLSIAVDDQRLYWINHIEADLSQAGLFHAGSDGSALANPRLTFTTDGFGVAVDDQHVYWTEPSLAQIARVGLDGAAPGTFLSLDDPVDLLAVWEPVASASASALGFGEQQVATIGAAQRLTFTNLRAASRIMSPQVMGADPADFLVSGDTCGVAPAEPGASCSVDVRFVPAATGARSASLRIDSDVSTDTPVTVSLAGSGTPPPIPVGPGAPRGGTGPSTPPPPAPPSGPTAPRGGTTPGSPTTPGAAVRIDRVACVTVRVLVGHGRGRHRVARTRCTVKLVDGPAELIAASAVSARLTANGHTYASNRASRPVRGGLTLMLTSAHRLAHGRYRLTVTTTRRGASRETATRWIAVR